MNCPNCSQEYNTNPELFNMMNFDCYNCGYPLIIPVDRYCLVKLVGEDKIVICGATTLELYEDE